MQKRKPGNGKNRTSFERINAPKSRSHKAGGNFLPLEKREGECTASVGQGSHFDELSIYNEHDCKAFQTPMYNTRQLLVLILQGLVM